MREYLRSQSEDDDDDDDDKHTSATHLELQCKCTCFIHTAPEWHLGCWEAHEKHHKPTRWQQPATKSLGSCYFKVKCCFNK